MTVSKPEIHVAAAIIVDERKRMLLVRKAGTTAFMQPGGKLEADEDPEEALRREVLEELGTAIASHSYVGRMSAAAANETGHIVTADLFTATLVSAPTPTAEIAEIIWLDPKQETTPEIAPLSQKIMLQGFV